MTITDFLALLRVCPLVASVQAESGSALNDAESLRRLALASLGQGVGVLRMQGVESIRAGMTLGVPVIGLVKRVYDGSDVYITPTLREVEEVLSTGCEVVALDMTQRARPNSADARHLVRRCHEAGRLVLGDIDSVESGAFAVACGADLVSTTLCGYTEMAFSADGPDLKTLRGLIGCGVPVLAEGRYTEPWEAFAALRSGASGVVIGGALNDPVKQTSRFLKGSSVFGESVGCVDLGGTWLRFGVLSPSGLLSGIERIPLPAIQAERMDWVRELALSAGVSRIGVSAGGVIEPSSGIVAEAKGFIPDYVGRSFMMDGFDVFALNDGLATAWGHALYSDFCGEQVATLALGSGVGAGVASVRGIETDRKGNYPRWNDLVVRGNQTVEDLLGGLNLDSGGETTQGAALDIARMLFTVFDNLFVDRILLCGGVGMSDWLVAALPQIRGRTPISLSPYGADAGLYGAGWLALKPPGGQTWPVLSA